MKILFEVTLRAGYKVLLNLNHITKMYENDNKGTLYIVDMINRDTLVITKESYDNIIKELEK